MREDQRSLGVTYKRRKGWRKENRSGGNERVVSIKPGGFVKNAVDL